MIKILFYRHDISSNISVMVLTLFFLYSRIIFREEIVNKHNTPLNFIFNYFTQSVFLNLPFFQNGNIKISDDTQTKELTSYRSYLIGPTNLSTSPNSEISSEIRNMTISLNSDDFDSTLPGNFKISYWNIPKGICSSNSNYFISTDYRVRAKMSFFKDSQICVFTDPNGVSHISEFTVKSSGQVTIEFFLNDTTYPNYRCRSVYPNQTMSCIAPYSQPFFVQIAIQEFPNSGINELSQKDQINKEIDEEIHIKSSIERGPSNQNEKTKTIKESGVDKTEEEEKVFKNKNEIIENSIQKPENDKNDGQISLQNEKHQDAQQLEKENQTTQKKTRLLKRNKIENKNQTREKEKKAKEADIKQTKQQSVDNPGTNSSKKMLRNTRTIKRFDPHQENEDQKQGMKPTLFHSEEHTVDQSRKRIEVLNEKETNSQNKKEQSNQGSNSTQKKVDNEFARGDVIENGEKKEPKRKIHVSSSKSMHFFQKTDTHKRHLRSFPLELSIDYSVTYPTHEVRDCFIFQIPRLPNLDSASSLPPRHVDVENSLNGDQILSDKICVKYSGFKVTVFLRITSLIIFLILAGLVMQFSGRYDFCGWWKEPNGHFEDMPPYGGRIHNTIIMKVPSSNLTSLVGSDSSFSFESSSG
ncbi:hypothetical protein TRFO_29532 [Tritrichomonas foetus]|uniref:Transmembrane protein n=1 Tax=Tritrichomonas foetus TaxID=1144522 RepID=A0A1J4JW25_9EUKA|nr:hypothetical protein TRFO_29532 [Tritrichomonas foetus]|eukprot:OHT03211.1 hypothetical protein TRFO_29532 [Tritrichomonas foetus]